jgi:hypothetical protein
MCLCLCGAVFGVTRGGGRAFLSLTGDQTDSCFVHGGLIACVDGCGAWWLLVTQRSHSATALARVQHRDRGPVRFIVGLNVESLRHCDQFVQ